MKRIAAILCILSIGVTTQLSAQKAEIFEEGDKYGLRTDFGKELLPADYEMIKLCKTDTLDFYIADLEGSSEIYSYSEQKRDVYDEAGKHNFTVIKFEWNKAVKANIFYGYDNVGNRFQFKGHHWNQLKVKGMIGGKNKSGKFAVCTGGKAISGYDYLAVDAKHKELVVVLTDTGWIALDTKMKAHYDWSFDRIHDSDIHPEAFIIEKGDKWGILSLDGSMNLRPSEMKNPQGMFDFDGDSYAELERSYAVKVGDNWGIVDEKGEENVGFAYDNAYMIDDFAIEQHDLAIHAVVQDGGTWKFLDEKWEEHKSVQFEQWLGVHGEVALVIKEGKVWQLDLKTFDTQANLYFGEYDEFQVVKTEDDIYGVVGKNGNIIMPFKYHWISLEDENPDDVFFIAEQTGLGGIFDAAGKKLLPMEYEDLLFLETKNDKKYFSVGNEGKSALAVWDVEAKQLNFLTKHIYKLVTYHYGDKMFSAETMDGVFHTLDDDGKMIEDEK